MATYTITLLDVDYYEVSSAEVEGQVSAKDRAKYMLTEEYARNIGTTHAALATHKVELRKEGEKECLWDKFYR